MTVMIIVGIINSSHVINRTICIWEQMLHFCSTVKQYFGVFFNVFLFESLQVFGSF